MSNDASPRFPVSLPVQWTGDEPGFEQELDRVQRQIHALLQERLVEQLARAWLQGWGEIRFYWVNLPSGEPGVDFEVLGPPLISENRLSFCEQRAFFQECLTKAVQQHGLAEEHLNRALGIDPNDDDRSVLFSSGEELVERTRKWVNETVGAERRKALLEESLPFSSSGRSGPRF